MEPRQPQQARAPRLPDRSQGLRPDGPRRPNQDQERDGSLPHVPPLVPRRDLRLVRDEHRRVQRPRVPDEDRGGGEGDDDDHSLAAYVCDKGSGGGHDEFL